MSGRVRATMPTKELLDAIDRNLLVTIAGCFLVTVMGMIGSWVKRDRAHAAATARVVEQVLERGLTAVIHGNGDSAEPSLASITATQVEQGSTLIKHGERLTAIEQNGCRHRTEHWRPGEGA